MKRALIAGTAVAAAAVTAITLSGQADAQPAGRHGEESFSIISTTSPSTGSIIATGFFTDGGTDHSGTSADMVTFPDGSFTLAHTGTKKSRFNTTTCLLTTTSTGTYKIKAGTRAYKGISGTGTFAFTVHAVFPRTRSGACNENADPAALQYVATGHGPASRP
jgi:hypothetical protein